MLLIAVLVVFESVPFITGNDTQYIYQASLQRARSQIFAKSAYALRYHTDGERAQAINDFQVTLPPFQQEQTVLSANTTPDVQNTVQIMRPDYLALITAVQAILAHPSTANSIEIEIILSHERGYLLNSSSLLILLQRHSDDRILQLFYIKVFVEMLLEILIILSIFTTKRVVKLVPQILKVVDQNKAK